MVTCAGQTEETTTSLLVMVWWVIAGLPGFSIYLRPPTFSLSRSPTTISSHTNPLTPSSHTRLAHTKLTTIYECDQLVYSRCKDTRALRKYIHSLASPLCNWLFLSMKHLVVADYLHLFCPSFGLKSSLFVLRGTAFYLLIHASPCPTRAYHHH